MSSPGSAPSWPGGSGEGMPREAASVRLSGRPAPCHAPIAPGMRKTTHAQAHAPKASPRTRNTMRVSVPLIASSRCPIDGEEPTGPLCLHRSPRHSPRPRRRRLASASRTAGSVELRHAPGGTGNPWCMTQSASRNLRAIRVMRADPEVHGLRTGNGLSGAPRSSVGASSPANRESHVWWSLGDSNP